MLLPLEQCEVPSLQDQGAELCSPWLGVLELCWLLSFPWALISLNTSPVYPSLKLFGLPPLWKGLVNSVGNAIVILQGFYVV